MSARARVTGAVGLLGIACALVISAIPATWHGISSAVIAPFVAAAVLAAGALVLSFPSVARAGRVRLESRRGLRQIEVVLRLEAALSTRRVPVSGSGGGCPRCGAPAGPHCVCRKG